VLRTGRSPSNVHLRTTPGDIDSLALRARMLNGPGPLPATPLGISTRLRFGLVRLSVRGCRQPPPLAPPYQGGERNPGPTALRRLPCPPQPDRPIMAGRGQRHPVGREGHGVDALDVAFKHESHLAGERVGETDLAVVTPRGERPAIG
jgi:hypothetical protein